MLKLVCFGAQVLSPLQPPSGGCVLKHIHSIAKNNVQTQPPSGGCVLKLTLTSISRGCCVQPPSGGCVLKPSR